jgi:hypothetical protein
MSSPCQKANTQKILTKIIVNISLQMIANQKPSPYFEKNESLILICVYMFISLCDKDTFYALNEEGTLWHSYIKRLHKIMKPVGGGFTLDAVLYLLALLFCVVQVTQSVFVTTNTRVNETLQIYFTNADVSAYPNYAGICVLNAEGNFFGNEETVAYAEERATSFYLQKIDNIKRIVESSKNKTSDYVVERLINAHLMEEEHEFDFGMSQPKMSVVRSYKNLEQKISYSIGKVEEKLGKKLEMDDAVVLNFAWGCTDKQSNQIGHAFYGIFSKNGFKNYTYEVPVLEGIFADPNYQTKSLKNGFITTKNYFSGNKQTFEEVYNTYKLATETSKCSSDFHFAIEDVAFSPVFVIKEQQALEMSRKMHAIVEETILKFQGALNVILDSVYEERGEVRPKKAHFYGAEIYFSLTLFAAYLSNFYGPRLVAPKREEPEFLVEPAPINGVLLFTMFNYILDATINPSLKFDMTTQAINPDKPFYYWIREATTRNKLKRVVVFKPDQKGRNNVAEVQELLDPLKNKSYDELITELDKVANKLYASPSGGSRRFSARPTSSASRTKNKSKHYVAKKTRRR